MRKYLLITLITLVSAHLFSQSIDQIKADRNAYIWGEGSGSTLKKADQEALAMLINQISTQVESRFEMLKNEDGNSFNEKFTLVINTYSAATLKNTERMVISDEPDAKVFRFIRRAEIDKIFEARKLKIIGFCRNAQQALKYNQIADALKYDYWALVLLKSHPDGSSIKFIDNTGQEQLLATWLPAQINSIFAGITVKMKKKNHENNTQTVVLDILYMGSLVSNYDYSYWDGRDWSNLVSAKDGLGFVEFEEPTENISEIRLKTEYVFEGEASVDNELRDVMLKIDPIPFRNSYISLKPDQMRAAQTSAQTETMHSGKAENIEMPSKFELPILSVSQQQPYIECIDKIKQAITTFHYEEVKSLFTNEGYDIFLRLIKYGKARILTNPELKFIKQGEEVICRSIPMSFKFENSEKQFVEDVVFHFDADKMINNLAFGLGEKGITDISGKTVWSEQVRMILIQFMENYKTAYALKRSDYIESLFADDALIIVGSVLKVKPNEMNPYVDNKIVKYNRYNKQDYMKKLRMSFQSNEFINIKFEDNEVRKSGKGGEVYGIQIKQNYYSANYADEGYLFLLIDMNNPDLPLIHVRTWQPEKNPDGSIYGVGDFN